MLLGISLCCVVITLGIVGNQISKGYKAPNKSAQISWMADYEAKFRHYEHIPQPTILAVDISLALFPEENAYSLKGTYSLQNLSSQPLDRLLLNFHPELNLEGAVFKFKNEMIAIDQITSEIFLNEPMTPGGEAYLEFDLSYQLHPYGGFSSDNAMLKNGSFLRLSRYLPEFGYLRSFELEDPELRKSFGLGEKTLPKTLEDPKENPLDMISLSIRISTSANQMAFGTGELVRAEKVNDRNFYTYRADSVPFRFAVSSGSYQQSSIEHKGIPIKVYFHPQHDENVDLLLAHAAYALDYCIKNFGDFPFESLSFVEVSSMASGFNATAYPAVIFINEGQAFHSRLKDQAENDVILELAAHEIAHFWWGGNRILPDQREGAAFLTETLAMYTEMMVYKHRYGVEKMKEKLDLHRQIYQMEKGYFVPQSLSRVNPSFTHLSYSKGALVMVELSELLGEERLNGMLKEFLTTYTYPKRPISLDLINILCKGATDLECTKIRELLEGN
ncbi:M1 family aminopeptidase [Algoriphagus confluentis]|uniref:Peptidase M1 membrane alanine aminopeptidase domain-containing protein n=1 Tax=Algoriphagus confluentis TaxID=1697556 RepID=A0ABQ6PSZ4_9BACT|nr:hypothetical protein Aconfl_33450 [Algoriphagus confluentis]